MCLYVAQSSGAAAARSDDRGVTFTPFDTGLDNAGAPRDLAITADRSAPQLLMATSKGSYTTPIPAGVTDRIFADGFDGQYVGSDNGARSAPLSGFGFVIARVQRLGARDFRRGPSPTNGHCSRVA